MSNCFFKKMLLSCEEKIGSEPHTKGEVLKVVSRTVPRAPTTVEKYNRCYLSQDEEDSIKHGRLARTVTPKDNSQWRWKNSRCLLLITVCRCSPRCSARGFPSWTEVNAFPASKDTIWVIFRRHFFSFFCCSCKTRLSRQKRRHTMLGVRTYKPAREEELVW